MKLIPLSKTGKKHAGKYFAQVDDEDYDFLMQWNWYVRISNKTSYAFRGIRNGKGMDKISMHREILKLSDKNLVGDHIDHNGLNNQKYNLRVATRRQNSFNKSARGRSKYLGVYFSVTKKKVALKDGNIKTYTTSKWVAQITPNSNKILIGSFDNEREAALAYDEAAKKHFGEFANLNFK